MRKKDVKIDHSPALWCGSHESYTDFQAKLKKADEYLASSDDPEDEDNFEDMYELDGNVGVIRINGHLTSGYAGSMFRAFGIIGYDDIAQAVALAAADRKAQKILLAVSSPGGSVAGVSQASSLLNALAKAKPMTGYTELAASAGYWLFSNAPYLIASDTAITGSIGVIRIHREYSKLEEKEGVTTTVMRAGKYKMLANPYEPLTDEAKAQIQSHLDDIYEGFIGVVAANRNTTAVIADQIMGQGREFIGKRGEEAGLVDAIGDYNEALAYASRNAKYAPSNINLSGSATASVVGTEFVAHNLPKHEPTAMTLKKTLTPEQIAAIAAGASIEASAEPVQPPAVIVDDTVSSATAEAPQEKVEASASTQTDNEIVAFLKTELTAAQTELVKANLQASAAASQVAVLQESQASLLAIAQGATKNLAVALARTVDVQTMDAKALVETHAELDTAFKASFKVGKVAASTLSVEQEQKKPEEPNTDTLASLHPMAHFAIKKL